MTRAMTPNDPTLVSFMTERAFIRSLVPNSPSAQSARPFRWRPWVSRIPASNTSSAIIPDASRGSVTASNTASPCSNAPSSSPATGNHGNAAAIRSASLPGTGATESVRNAVIRPRNIAAPLACSCRTEYCHIPIGYNSLLLHAGTEKRPALIAQAALTILRHPGQGDNPAAHSARAR